MQARMAVRRKCCTAHIELPLWRRIDLSHWDASYVLRCRVNRMKVHHHQEQAGLQ